TSHPNPSSTSSVARTAAAKRTSTALPKPASLSVDGSALIAQHAVLTGSHPISVGASVVLHPHSKVSSAWAPVVLGEGAVVGEKAAVGVIGRVGEVVEKGKEGVLLGRNVVVETGAVVEAREVGEGTVVEGGARIGVGCVVGKFCTITSSTVIPPYTMLPDYTVVYGASAERRIDTTLRSRADLRETKMLMHAKQIEVFKKLIPNNVTKW
ncbi:trimeric LpxA-like protein, partial [Lepidopterella palustris CBS 459.81]